MLLTSKTHRTLALVGLVALGTTAANDAFAFPFFGGHGFGGFGIHIGGFGFRGPRFGLGPFGGFRRPRFVELDGPRFYEPRPYFRHVPIRPFYHAVPRPYARQAYVPQKPTYRAYQTPAASTYQAPAASTYQATAPNGYQPQTQSYAAQAAQTSATPAAVEQPTFVSVLFLPTATTTDVANFMKAYNITVSNGPSADGVYRVQVSTGPVPQDQLNQVVESMRSQTNVVSQVGS